MYFLRITGFSVSSAISLSIFFLYSNWTRRLHLFLLHHLWLCAGRFFLHRTTDVCLRPFKVLHRNILTLAESDVSSWYKVLPQAEKALHSDLTNSLDKTAYELVTKTFLFCFIEENWLTNYNIYHYLLFTSKHLGTLPIAVFLNGISGGEPIWFQH